MSRTMEMLSDNIEQMREFGIGLGLDDKDIDACICKSLESPENEADDPPEGKRAAKTNESHAETSHKRKPKRFSCLTVVSLFSKAVKVSVVACFLCWCFYIASLFHEPSHALFNSLSQTYGYTAMRVVRIASLPLWHIFDLSDLRGDNCVVRNPYFLPEELDCKVCHNITRVMEVREVTADFHSKYQATITRLTDEAGSLTTFQDLKSAYQRNTYKLQRRDLSIRTNMKGVTSLAELMTTKAETRLKYNPFAHIEWHSTQIGAAQVLREVFKRPSFIPVTSEILIERLLYIDGHRAKPYTIESFGSSSMWYVQGSGQRQLVFIPLGRCSLECDSVQVTVSAGHILYYPAGVWRVDSLPHTSSSSSSSSQDLSLSFIGSFI